MGTGAERILIKIKNVYMIKLSASSNVSTFLLFGWIIHLNFLYYIKIKRYAREYTTKRITKI